MPVVCAVAPVVAVEPVEEDVVAEAAVGGRVKKGTYAKRVASAVSDEVSPAFPSLVPAPALGGIAGVVFFMATIGLERVAMPVEAAVEDMVAAESAPGVEAREDETVEDEIALAVVWIILAGTVAISGIISSRIFGGLPGPRLTAVILPPFGLAPDEASLDGADATPPWGEDEEEAATAEEEEEEEEEEEAGLGELARRVLTPVAAMGEDEAMPLAEAAVEPAVEAMCEEPEIDEEA